MDQLLVKVQESSAVQSELHAVATELLDAQDIVSPRAAAARGLVASRVFFSKKPYMQPPLQLRVFPGKCVLATGLTLQEQPAGDAASSKPAPTSAGDTREAAEPQLAATAESAADAAPAAKRRKGMPNTLAEILMAAKADKWALSSKVPEKTALQRIEQLLPFLQDFVRTVRIEEGFLSQAQVLQEVKHSNDFNRLTHELCQARQAYTLSGARRSRFSAWANFTERCVQRAAAANATLGAEPFAKEIENFVPACHVPFDSPQAYQLLAVRSSGVAQNMLAVTLSVFRGSLVRKRVTSKMFTQPITANTCRSLHVVCLSPEIDEGTDKVTLTASCLSPVVVLDPHDPAGLILFEIPATHWTAKESRMRLEVTLEKSIFLAVRSMEPPGSAEPKVPKVPDGHMEDAMVVPQPPAVPFTALSFPANAKGFQNIRDYVNHMRLLYFEVSGKHLLDEDGRVRHLPDKPSWENVVATAPVHLMQKIKGKKKDFGALVMVEFRSISPSHEKGCTAFLGWLREASPSGG